MSIVKRLFPWFIGTLLVILLTVTSFLVYDTWKDEKNITQNTIEDAVLSTVLIHVDVIEEADRPQANIAGLLGTGSGFFIKVTDDKGYIVTNHHVIENYEKLPTKLKIKVMVPKRPWEYKGTILGFDPITDIAVIEIEKQDEEEWTALKWGNSWDIKDGTTIFSVGHGLNFYWSVTSGIVSSKDRINLRPLNFMLQHDAVINSGNSGGPVLNSRGEVVGVNDLLVSPRLSAGIKNPGWDGISIAIPSWQAKISVDQILEQGHVTYPDFNFTFKFLDTPAEAQRVSKLLNGKRSYVQVTWEDDGVEDAKKEIEKWGEQAIQEGDIIYKIDGEEVRSPLMIIKTILTKKANTVIEFDIVRGDKLVKAKYALGVFRQPGQSVIVMPPK